MDIGRVFLSYSSVMGKIRIGSFAFLVRCDGGVAILAREMITDITVL